MSFWENPAVRAALREVLIAVLVAILGLVGYHASVKRQIAQLRADLERALHAQRQTQPSERTRP